MSQNNQQHHNYPTTRSQTLIMEPFASSQEIQDRIEAEMRFEDQEAGICDDDQPQQVSPFQNFIAKS
jgi:hypothetical protein